MNAFDNSGNRVPPTPARIGGGPPYKDYNYQQPPRWRGLFFFIAGIIVVLLLLWGYLFFLLRPFTPFTANNEVAKITVLHSRQGSGQLSVQVTHFDANGYEKIDKPYLINGDKVVLKYEYVTLPDWLGFFGLHSGYILIGLEGYSNNDPTGSNRALGAPDQNQLPLVSPKFGSITFTVDGKTHPLMMTQMGIQEH